MAWIPASDTRRRWAVLGLLIATVAVPLLITACGGAGSLEVKDLRNADAPYYYVGESFHGLKISYVQRYQRSDAAIIYGDCKVRFGIDPGSCTPPLELEHRLCHGDVTVVIWARETLAARAADALRPLSRGASSAQRPKIAFGHSPYCSP